MLQIVTDNSRNHVCPFHATRDLMAGGGTKDEGEPAFLSALPCKIYTVLIYMAYLTGRDTLLQAGHRD